MNENKAKTKKCSGWCGKILEINSTNFQYRKKYKDGFSGQCKNCIDKGVPPKIIVESGIFKKCNGICGRLLDLNSGNFKKRTGSADGFRGQCKECQGKGELSHIIIENGIKYQVCTSKCKQRKELNLYNFNKHDKNFLRQCKVCVLELKQEYVTKNEKETVAYQKKYREEHKEELYEQNRIYRSKPENKKRKNENEQLKIKNDPVYRLKCTTSRIIRGAIKSEWLSESNKAALSYLPYTIDELKNHLESLWEPWMNWSNWGLYDKNRKTWQIDHIVPQSFLPFDSLEHPNFIKCWKLSNLQPLETIANIKKGKKLMENICFE